jgi:hypothetical protein
VTISLHATDHRLGGIASPQFVFNDAENAALLARDEDAARALGVMTATALVDIAALDLAAGELFSGFDDGFEGVTVV